MRMEKGKISVQQFFLLATFFIIGTTILVVPTGLAADAKQDAGIAAVLGVFLTVLVLWLYTLVARKLGNYNIVEFNEKILGKWLGGFVSLSYIMFGLLAASILLFYVGNFMVTQIMTETPIQFINATFAVIIIMGIRLGLETMARAAEILFPWFVGMYLVITLSVVREVELNNFLPILEHGLLPIVKASLPFVAYSGFPVIALFMFYPLAVHDKRRASRALLHAAWVGGSFVVIITILTVLILGPDHTARQVYPTYALAKKIQVGDFLQRIEALVAAMWVLGIYMKATLYLYSSITGLAQMLKLHNYRTLTFPMGMIAIVLSLTIYPNTTYMNYWDTYVFVPYALTLGLGIPLLLLVAVKVRKMTGTLTDLERK